MTVPSRRCFFAFLLGPDVKQGVVREDGEQYTGPLGGRFFSDSHSLKERRTFDDERTYDTLTQDDFVMVMFHNPPIVVVVG